MNRFINRRRFALGAGLLLGGVGTQLGRSALAQDFERRDPRPQYSPFHTEPVRPTLVQRWDTKLGNLVPEGGQLDSENPFSAAPSHFLQFSEPGTRKLFSYENSTGLGIGLYHIYLVVKAERLIGPIAMDINITNSEGNSYTRGVSLETRRSKFDWTTYVVEFGEHDGNAPRITGIDSYITLDGTGRLWIGAVEIVNLGLLAADNFFFEDRFGPGN